MTLSIEVYFDFICPWCLIGKRQLDQALAQLRVAQPEVQVAVSWRGVQLLPALPVQGEAFHDFYLRRLGSEQGMSLRQAQVRQAAASVGVELDFGKIPRMPNTADAHRLWQRACQLGSPSQCEALLESLFANHFLHGGDLGDGTPFLGTAEGPASQGVPSFVLGGQVLSGAQPVERLLASLHQAIAAAARTSATRIAVPAERVPAPGKRILIEAEGKSLVLFNVDGRFHAIDDGCPHQGASLCGGRLEGEVIQCCAHGLRFNLNTGYLLGSTQLRVNRYPVERAGDQLHIVIPQEDAASCTR